MQNGKAVAKGGTASAAERIQVSIMAENGWEWPDQKHFTIYDTPLAEDDDSL